MAGGLNRNITVRLLADTSKFTAGMAKVSAEAEKTSTTMEASGGKTKLLTAGIAAAGIAATALGVAAVRMAADFDAGMSTVQANTGASADEMSLLRQAAIDAGADTVYSATDAADAINELGKAGMSTSDILSGGLNGALDLAASDGMEVAEAAELMSSAMAQFNLTGADATRIADALAAGAGKAQGSARDLGYALQQSGMVANSFGIGMEETVGTLTSFANAGMTGSDAGTSLKSMLIALANPTKKAQNLMDELGISAYDAQGNFIGLKALAGQLQTQMSGLTQAQRNQALATIFGSDAIRAANVLYNEGADGIADWTKKVSDSGYAAQQAAAKNDNLRGDLENLSGSFESMMIKLGEGGQGPLRKLVQTIDMLVDGFGQLPAPVQQTIVLSTALAGGIVALHRAMAPLNSSSSQLSKNLGMVLDPLITGNDALAGTADASAKAADSDTILQESFGATKDAVNETSAALGEVIDALNTYYGFALDASNASIALESSFDKASEAVGKNGRTLDINTEKGRDNTSALNDVAEAAQKAMLAHAKNGEGLEQITPIVQRARDQYIQLAQQMGMSKEEAEASADAYGLNTDKLRDLIVQSGIASGQTGDLQAAFDRLGLSTSDVKLKVDNMVGSMRLIPAEKTTTVRVNDLASNAIHTIREGIELLQSKTVTIRTNVITNETTIRSTKGSMIGRPISYTGGYYAGNGFAMRGYYGGGIVEGLLPGTPPLSAQADNITLANARLRSGEFVSNDKSVRYYGADTYAAMNRRQLPREMFTPGAEQPGPSVADISQGVMDALERTSVTLVFDDRTVAARLAPAMDRELGRRKGMGL